MIFIEDRGGREEGRKGGREEGRKGRREERKKGGRRETINASLITRPVIRHP